MGIMGNWGLKWGMWQDDECDDEKHFICANRPQVKSGNYAFVLKSDSLRNPVFHFWWNSTNDSNGFEISWHIENGSLLDVMDLRIAEDMSMKKTSGSISTPGLGLPAPKNYFKESLEGMN